MTQYLYDGILPENTAYNIKSMMQKYPYAMEASQHPTYDDLQRLLKQQDYWQESGMDGRSYKQTGILYGMVQNWGFRGEGVEGGFLFVNNQEDYDSLIEFLTEKGTLVNAQPFKTLVG